MLDLSPRIRIGVILVAVACLTTLALPSRAEEDPFAGAANTEAGASSGPEIALRTGYGVAAGRLEEGVSIASELSSVIPVAVDFGYRLDGNWFIGGYAQYALGINSATTRATCPDCTTTWVRYGVAAKYYFLDGALWAGLGVGRHSLNTTLDDDRRESRTLAGWELFELQAGSQWSPVSGLAFGPFLALSLTTIEQHVERCENEYLCPIATRNVERSTQGTGVGAWLSAGLRIVVLP